MGTEFSGFFARKKATKLRPQSAPQLTSDIYSLEILLHVGTRFSP